MKPTPSNTNVTPELTRMLGYLEQDPKNEPLTFQTIDLCIAENQLDLADRLLGNAAEHWPNATGVLNRNAIVALRRNNPQTAIVELEKIVAGGQADSAIRYNLAYANYLTGNYARVREVIEPTFSDTNRTPAIDPLYVLSLHQLGEMDTAIAYAEERLKVNPNDTELQGVLALLYLDAEKDMEACRRHTEAALRKNPEHPMALIAASSLSMMDEKPSAALDLAQRIIKRNPQDGRAWSSMGVAYMYLLDLPAAQRALETAVQYMPGHIGTWHALAWTQFLRNDVDGAEASINKANEIDRTFGETQGALAVIAQLRGDPEKAKRLMERARRLAPDGLTIQYVKLLQLKENGDPAGEMKFLQDLLKRRPSFRGDSVLDMFQRMGRVRLKTDDTKEKSEPPKMH